MVSSLAFLGTCLWAATVVLVGPMGIRSRTRHYSEIPSAWLCFALGALMFAAALWLVGA